eukprot:TRINITY_DN27327_c0_g1_i1.p1 TRINITY_DN27327_c0_g1~~TRINITY_DN27327_c0_g1_i1.p1  ORF type:complete len:364 (-),score=28.98 TRINITY_DN27327_c0_g1_i1:29-1120(-)
MAHKRIKNHLQLDEFIASDAYKTIETFITRTCMCIKGKKNSTDSPTEPERLKAVIAMLDEFSKWVKEIPLLDKQSQRYGNKAFRDWHQKLKENAPELVKTVLQTDSSEEEQAKWLPHVGELCCYLYDAFGNDTRIDYGTGHELHFVCFCLCLFLLGAYTEDDFFFVITRVLLRYFKLMREIQEVYSQEPAGSQGVWGLDDYHHLPFLYGAQQMIGNPDGIEPGDVLRESLKCGDDYFYVSAIQWIMKEKKAALFHEHSPLLYDATLATSWEKVYKGMSKLFQEKVLTKYPVIQHLLFGELIKFEPKTADDAVPASTAAPTGTAAPWATGGMGITAAPWAKAGAPKPMPGMAPTMAATRAPWAK